MMFWNLVTLHDIVVFAQRIRSGRIGALAHPFKGERARVENAWRPTETSVAGWLDIPAVQKRIDAFITGSPGTNAYQYVSQKYVSGAHIRKAVSFGCGIGKREREWLRACPQLSIDAFDISPVRIERARVLTEHDGLGDRVTFTVADVRQRPFPGNSYDLAFAEHALHHLAPMKHIIGKIHSTLRPGGLLVVNEFVGPSRFQWTARQIGVVSGLLGVLPERFRVTSHSLKRHAHRPGRLSMYLSDPSEAGESAAIPALLQELFDAIEVKEYGGTILHLLFKDIAHNFLSGDQETEQWLAICFAVEDCLLQTGKIPSDFLFGVFRK